MGRCIFTISLIFLLLPVLPLHAKNTASGKLTMNGSITEIKYAYLDEGPYDVFLVLTDRPVDRENIPWGLNNLSMDDKVRGMVITISKDTKQITRGLNAIYHPVTNGQLGTIGNGILTIKSFDTGVATGRLYTPEENSFSDYKYSYDISFDVEQGPPPTPEPIKVQITGDNDPPSKAYAQYYRALMSGDKPGIRKHLANEIEKQTDEQTLDTVVELARMTKPSFLKILSSEIKGEDAFLKVQGDNNGDVSNGSVNMKLEEGQWKVLKDSWKIQMK